MAYGVQVGTRYEIIGGPREISYQRANWITNPKLDVDSTGYSANNGHTGARVTIGNASYLQAKYGYRITTVAGAVTPVLMNYNMGTLPQAGRWLFGAWVWNGTGNQDTVIMGTEGQFAGGTQVVAPVAVPANSTWTFQWMIWDLVAGDLTGNLFGRFNSVTPTTVGQQVYWTGLHAQMVPASTTGLSTAGLQYSPYVFDGDRPGYYWEGDPGNSISRQDGTRAVLNDEDDPDFVGYLGDITGLDSAEVRENSVDNIEADGGLHGEFFQGRRPITMTAYIGPNTTDTVRNQRLQRWQAATRALRRRGPAAHRPAVLRWFPSGATREMYVGGLRRQQKVNTTGLRMKESSVAMIAEDPNIYAVQWELPALHSLSGSGTAGRTYDRSYNINFNWAPSRGQTTINHGGDTNTPLLIEIATDVSQFAVQNLTTEEEIALNGAIVLAFGDRVWIDCANKRVWHVNSTTGEETDYFDRVELSRSRWLSLVPGANVLQPLAATFAGSANIYFHWRTAWA